jgi:polyisoprenoid-binding protein YceI
MSREFYTILATIISGWSLNIRETAVNKVIIAATFLVSGVVAAEPLQFTADKWHTRIYFTVNHMGLSGFSGRFKEFDVDFSFDEEDFSNSRVEVTVPVASIDTFSPELNSKMGDEGFFDSTNHPEMHFISTRIEQVDAKTARMAGDLTIKGTTLEAIFDVTFNGKVLHPRFNLNNAGFTATATIDNRAYGVNPLPEWMLAAETGIRIEMETFEGDSIPYYSE